MAEEVKIVDVAGGPAAEATLQELLKVMKQMASKSVGSSSNAAESAQNLYTTAVTQGTKTKKDNTKAVKGSTEELGLLSKAASGVRSSFNRLGSIVGGTVGLVTNFATAIGKASTIGEVLEAIPVFGSVLSSATGYFQTSVDTFRQLSEVGAGFGNDMMAVRRASAEAGLSLEQFASMVGNNSQTLNLLGGTASEGAARMGRLTKELRSQEAGLTRLGFTQEQVNEGFASFVEQQASAGRLRGQSDAQLAAGAQNYMMELDKLSKITGKSRKELADQMNQQSAAANVVALRSRLSGEALQNFDSNLATVNTFLPGLGDAFSDAADGIAQSPLARTLASTVPGFQDLAEQMGRGELTQEQFNERLQSLAPRIQEFIGSLDPAAVQQLMGREGFGDMLSSFRDVTTLTQRMGDAQKAAAEQLERNKLTEQFATFEQTIQNVKSTFEKALIDSGILETLGGLFGDLGTGITSLAEDGVEWFAEYLKSPSFQTALTNFQTWIAEAATKVKTFITDIGDVGFTEAIKNLFKGEDGTGIDIGGMFGNFVKDAFNSLLPSLDTVLVGLAASIATLIFAPVAAPFLAIGAALAAMFGWETIKSWVSDAWNSITGMFSGIEDWWSNLNFSEMLSNTWKSVKEWFGFEGIDFSISRLAKDAWETVTGWFDFGGMGFSIRTIASNLWNTVTGWFNMDGIDFSISALATMAWEIVKGWFSLSVGIVTGLAGLATAAWETVTSWFSFAGIEFSISGLMSDAWNTVTGFFNLGDIELPSISDLFSGIIDKVKSFFSFDFELPDFKEYLPSWLGGGGKSLPELFSGSSSPGGNATSQLSQSTATQEPVTLGVPQNAASFGGLDFSNANQGALELQATLANIGSLQSFNSELDRIQQGLNVSNVDSYNIAMERLVDTLEDLNEVLAEDNKGLFGRGTGVSAANVIGAGGAGGSDQQLTKLDQLNSTMMAVLQELQNNTEYSRRTSRSVRGNNLQA